ncbi:MAG: peptidylprolyl isomerase [Clostridia bacterium]|nr:peptidylprolyl isomerase [Clostridia bacterium]
MANNKKNRNYVTEKNDVATAQKKKSKRNQKIKEVVKQVLFIILAIALVTVLVTGVIHIFKACTRVDEREFLNPNVHTFEVTDTVELKLAGYDEPLIIDLYGKDAPKTVENFKKLIQEGFFTNNPKFFTIDSTNAGLKFSHSDTKNAEDGHDHSNDSLLKGEFYDNDVSNRISHVTGVITMTNSGFASSKTDFMILTSDKHSADKAETDEDLYDGSRAAFGKVRNMSVVEKMLKDFDGTTDKENAVITLNGGANIKKPTTKNIADKYVDCVFTPKYSGTYIFTGSANYVAIAFDGAEAETLGTVEKKLEKDTEYKIRLTIKDTAKAEDSFTLTIKDRIIKTDSTTSITITPQNKTDEKIFNYVYQAPVTGSYVFTYEKIKDVIVKDKDGNQVNGTSAKAEENKVTYDFVANEKYSFEIPAVGAEFANTTSSVTAKISIDLKYFNLGNTTDIKFTEAEIGDKTIVYLFQTGVAGQYNFAGTVTDKGLDITDLDGNKLNIKLPKDNDSDPDVYSKSAILEANKTYKLIITTEGLSKDSKYTLKIAEPVLVGDVNTITIADANLKFLNAEGKEEAGKLSFIFVAKNNGKHVVSIDVKDVENIKIYNEAGSELGNNSAMLEKGKTYRFVIDTANNTNFKKDATCKITVDEPVLKVNTSKTVNAEKADKELAYEFTATSTAGFDFTVTGVTTGKTAEEKKAIQEKIDKAVTLYVNGVKVDYYKYASLKKGDVCKLVIDAEKLDGMELTVKAAKSSPKIESIKIVK